MVLVPTPATGQRVTTAYSNRLRSIKLPRALVYGQRYRQRTRCPRFTARGPRLVDWRARKKGERMSTDVTTHSWIILRKTEYLPPHPSHRRLLPFSRQEHDQICRLRSNREVWRPPPSLRQAWAAWAFPGSYRQGRRC